MSKREDFHDRLARFINYLGLKPTSFEVAMGFSNGSISKLLNEKRALGSDRLETIVFKHPELNISWLIIGKGEMLIKPGASNILVTESGSTPTTLIPIDKEGNMMIPIAEIKAAAGTGYLNTEVLRTSEFIQLPPNLAKAGRYLCIRIKGNSMSPTLQDGGYVVIRLLDRGDWKHLINDRVYVISDREGNTFLKRVRNRLDKGFLVLTSDNPDKATYGNFNLHEADLLTIWYVEWYLSAKMPNVHDQFYSKVERLENSLDDLMEKVNMMEQKQPKKI